MSIRLSYFIPTLGRSTLARAVDSVLTQLETQDELFVVSDGPSDAARSVMATRQRWNVFYLEYGPTRHYGSEQIEYATQIARGDFLCYLGDDDLAVPEALLRIRTRVSEVSARPHIFAMLTPDGVVRKGYGLPEQAVSGQQIIVPNDKLRLPRYDEPSRQVNDQAFLTRVVAAWQDVGLGIHDDVIAKMPMAGEGRMF